MGEYCVYMHVFPNQKRYIGITGDSPKKRWKRGKNYRNNIHLTRAVEKYGWDNIKHIIVETDLDKESAEAKERMLISLFNSNDPKHGYNVTSGGECIGKHSDETRRKISETKKAQCLNPEYRELMSRVHKGISPPNKGKPMSQEQKLKISLAKRGTEGRGKRKVICIETGTIYESITKAAELVGIGAGKIVQVCKHTRNTAKGFHWEYVED